MVTSLFRRLIPKPVPNSGSELRDHLANERTFLSWTRMGLAFAAMALALGRLDLIDRMFNTRWGNDKFLHPSSPSQPEQQSTKKTLAQAQSPEKSNPPTQSLYAKDGKAARADLLASRVCQAISIWCFGYGLYRYVSIRRNLMRGQFVPGIWGPVLMTCGSLGVFGTVMHFDWKKSISEVIGERRNGN